MRVPEAGDEVFAAAVHHLDPYQPLVFDEEAIAALLFLLPFALEGVDHELVITALREPLLQVTALAAGTRDELIHLAAAVSAHLDFEGAFTVQVGHQVCVISHGGTQEESGRSAPVARPGVAELAVGSRPPKAARTCHPGCRARLRSRIWRQRARLSGTGTQAGSGAESFSRHTPR